MLEVVLYFDVIFTCISRYHHWISVYTFILVIKIYEELNILKR